MESATGRDVDVVGRLRLSAGVLDIPGLERVAETHISTVYFTPTRVYKALKPVDFGFLDHRTVDARRRSVLAEIEQNRRFAPDVYLGVAEVVGAAVDGATPTGRAPGETVVDHLVVMRRLPDNAKLSRRLDHRDTAAQVRGVARIIASVHSDPRATPDQFLVREADHAHLLARWAENFAVLDRTAIIDPTEVAAVTHLVTEFISGRRNLLDRRIQAGFIRDGHGDLLCDDIFCLDDGVRILDCLAFSDELRTVDVLDDVSFLAMDLEHRGHPELAEDLLADYVDFTAETHPVSLAHHYIAYRAHVRAKVGALRVSQGGGEPHTVRALHRLALEHLERSRVRLILVGGGPGTGKSTLAQHLSDSTGWVVLRSDSLRKDLCGLAHADRAFADIDNGIYDPSITRNVYAEMLRRAEILLHQGESVVLDASWADPALRADAASAAVRAGAALSRLHVGVPAAVAASRLADRLVDGLDASDARPEHLRSLNSRAGDWNGWVHLDGTTPVEDLAESAIHGIGAPRPWRFRAALAQTKAAPGRQQIHHAAAAGRADIEETS